MERKNDMKTILTILLSIAIFLVLYKLFIVIILRRIGSYSKRAELRRKADFALNREIQKDHEFYRS